MKIKYLIATLSLACSIAVAQNVPSNKDKTVFQVSPLQALNRGVYSKINFTYGQLKTHGDFGIGTFVDLDGEMVALDGKFYQMNSDGTINLVNDQQSVPFAEVCFFNPDIKDIEFKDKTSFSQLNKYILSFFKNKNTPYAIKINAKFKEIKLRIVRKQSKKFVNIEYAIKGQYVYTLKNVSGTLVGFWFPGYLKNVAIANMHLHFIDSTNKMAGHVLDLNIEQGSLSIERLNKLDVYFPNTEDFDNANLEIESSSNK